jgi:hypothetical protein
VVAVVVLVPLVEIMLQLHKQVVQVVLALHLQSQEHLQPMLAAAVVVQIMVLQEMLVMVALVALAVVEMAQEVRVAFILDQQVTAALLEHLALVVAVVELRQVIVELTHTMVSLVALVLSSSNI